MNVWLMMETERIKYGNKIYGMKKIYVYYIHNPPLNDTLYSCSCIVRYLDTIVLGHRLQSVWN